MGLHTRGRLRWPQGVGTILPALLIVVSLIEWAATQGVRHWTRSSSLKPSTRYTNTNRDKFFPANPYFVHRLVVGPGPTARHPGAEVEGLMRSTSSAPAPALTPAVTVAAIKLSIKSRAIQDSRCYLMNGGAVESFFISEDTPVGSVIGTLSVNGSPADPGGDITLKLQEKEAAIGIAPGTKNLTLLRALDREERAGPSNVYVNVRCDRRRTTDPSFIIPVSVRVWDVNDNAPVWSGAPYTVRLSELTAVGSRVLQGARATDVDQPGPHATVHYSVLPGPNSEYFGFLNELDSVLVVKRPLDYETLGNFTLTLRAQDAGRPPLHADTTLHVEVLDADDQNPRFSHDHYTALLPDDAQEGTELVTQPGPVSARDQDLGINAPLQYSATGDAQHLVLVEKDTGKVRATAALLDADLPATIVLKATQYDNSDRYALATLSVQRRSQPLRAVRFLQRAFSAAVREDTPVGAVLATLHTNQHRHDKSPLQFYVSERGFLEKFAINSGGELLLRRALDYETQDQYLYQVMVTDGDQNDTASLNITVLNVNDWEPRFRYPQYEFNVDTLEGEEGEGEGAGLMSVGKVEVFDGDKGDYVALSLRGPDSSLFYINDMGEMFMKREALSTLNSSVVRVTATAHDSGTPPRQTSVPVIVHVSPALLQAGRGSQGGGGAVFALFVAALTLLALLVLALLGYIYRNKRTKPSPAPNKPSGGFVQHEKAPHSASASPPARSSTLGAAPSGSLLSVSAGASTILANSNSSLDLRAASNTAANNALQTTNATVGRQSQRFPAKTKIAPAPPVPPAAGEGGLALMSDHIGAGGGRSGVAWPSATIPARVKKLSWDDADKERKAGAECGELHDATNPTLAEHMNLTVYF